MKNKIITPSILLIGLVFCFVVYLLRNYCFENEYRNCKVNKQNFENIELNNSFQNVVKILGIKNFEKIWVEEDLGFENCDSLYTWQMEKYFKTKSYGIVICFKNDMVLQKEEYTSKKVE